MGTDAELTQFITSVINLWVPSAPTPSYLPTRSELTSIDCSWDCGIYSPTRADNPSSWFESGSFFPLPFQTGEYYLLVVHLKPRRVKLLDSGAFYSRRTEG